MGRYCANANYLQTYESCEQGGLNLLSRFRICRQINRYPNTSNGIDDENKTYRATVWLGTLDARRFTSHVR